MSAGRTVCGLTVDRLYDYIPTSQPAAGFKTRTTMKAAVPALEAAVNFIRKELSHIKRITQGPPHEAMRALWRQARLDRSAAFHAAVLLEDL